MLPVRAYHLILTTYGFWLPNDPRGSWSDFVRSWELLIDFGPATKTTERRSLARDAHDVRARLAAKEALHRKPVVFTGVQALAVAYGFSDYVRKSQIVVYACSIMPKHVHIVVARHRYSIEQIANLLKGAGTRALVEEKLHPFQGEPYRDGTLPTPWARGCWKCFLMKEEEIERAIKYVEENPAKEGKRAQPWSFITKYGAPRVGLRPDR